MDRMHSTRWFTPKNWIAAVALVLFGGMAVYLWQYSSTPKPFSETLLVRDLIWLDMWGLLFVLTTVVVWLAGVSWRIKSAVLVAVVSVYGYVVICLLLDGTAFSLNGYWGDQKFRIAMIEKFATWWVPKDFYYKDLSPFYPPVLYYVLSLFARLDDAASFAMMKFAAQAIHFVSPFFVWFLWRRIVSDRQAAVITVVSFVYLLGGRAFALSVPHAMLGNIFFVPWWLYYIEQVKHPAPTRSFFVRGGLIGGLIFMTYFYGFFIGGFLLLLRVVFFSRLIRPYVRDSFRLWPAIGVMLAAAVVSSLYWGPLMADIAKYGVDKGTGWHHIDSVGVNFSFMTLTVSGLLFLGGLLYALRRVHSSVNRALVTLVSGIVCYYLLGTFLGALDRPINLIKAAEFLAFVTGPVIALALVAFSRAAHGRPRVQRVFAALGIVLLLSLVYQANVVGKSGGIAEARKSQPANWGFGEERMVPRRGTVFLSAWEELPSFYPVYLFVAPNHHYSHPAARYTGRYRLLSLVQHIDDPYLLNLTLTSNTFDGVDFVHLRSRESVLYLTMVLDNYPNRYTLQEIQFSPEVFEDERFFRRQEVDGFFSVVDSPTTAGQGQWRFKGTSRDSLLFLARWRVIRQWLNVSAQEESDRYLGVDWTKWRDFPMDSIAYDLDGRFDLMNTLVVDRKDSLHLFLTLHARVEPTSSYRIFLHAFGDGDSFDNHDFLPLPRFNNWQKEDVRMVHTVIPNRPEYTTLRFGLFYEGKRFGDGVRLSLNQGGR